MIKINDKINISGEHIVLTVNGLLKAKDLKTGDVLINGKEKIKIINIFQYTKKKNYE